MATRLPHVVFHPCPIQSNPIQTSSIYATGLYFFPHVRSFTPVAVARKSCPLVLSSNGSARTARDVCIPEMLPRVTQNNAIPRERDVMSLDRSTNRDSNQICQGFRNAFPLRLSTCAASNRSLTIIGKNLGKRGRYTNGGK